MTPARSMMIAVTATALMLAGCKTAPPQQTAGGCKPLPGTERTDETTATLIGAAAGALIGGAAGRSTTKKKAVGTRNGALLGAVAGALAGNAYAKSVGMSEGDDGSVTLDVPGNVLFPTGSYQLSSSFKDALTSVAGTIKEYCGVTAQVVGHTDNVGSYESNLVLSNNRAKSVVAYLSSQGVDSYRLSADGVADTQPKADNTTESGRQQNRRVDIIIRPPVQ